MGELFTWDRFVKLVQQGCFIDYDGCGDILNAEKEVIGHVKCSSSWLRRFKKEHPEATQVRWFNR